MCAILHTSRPMTAERAQRDCEADVVLLGSYRLEAKLGQEIVDQILFEGRRRAGGMHSA